MTTISYLLLAFCAGFVCVVLKLGAEQTEQRQQSRLMMFAFDSFGAAMQLLAIACLLSAMPGMNAWLYRFLLLVSACLLLHIEWRWYSTPLNRLLLAHQYRRCRSALRIELGQLSPSIEIRWKKAEQS